MIFINIVAKNGEKNAIFHKVHTAIFGKNQLSHCFCFFKEKRQFFAEYLS
jgi:hypothetical protein